MIKIINRKKNRPSVESPRGKKKSSGKWLFRLAVVLFAATVIFALFFADFLSITTIKITGLDKLEEAPIREIINEKLSGKYLGLVKKNNLLIFPGNKLERELVGKFKRIESVDVEKKFPGEVDVTIKERKFTMFLCSAGECFVLNERGEAYPAGNFSPEELEKENLVTLSDVSDTRIFAENNPLEDDFREFILELAGKMQYETGVVLKKQYETPSRMSGDLKVETGGGWKIYFSESVGMDKEMLMLGTVLERKISPEQQKDLEYIDLRIPNKVFYKFKDGTEQSQVVENTPAPVTEVKKEEKRKK
ncbi:MAG: FtsQ-type POTRA domain-containing protein [Candidatus Moranbacteria bacterium]|nr:FtsQ-type POTRA domain-containing protein [Candidatus Moranbacteria bacterium]